jgi:hypothetical protein
MSFIAKLLGFDSALYKQPSPRDNPLAQNLFTPISPVMPTRTYYNEFDELSKVLDDVAGHPVGYKRTMTFSSLRDTLMYRQALYTRRARAKWPEGCAPWDDITIRCDRKNFTLTLERYPGRPKWLPRPLKDTGVSE